MVVYNDGIEYEMVGPRDALTIVKDLHFRCCDWRGVLRDGYWIGSCGTEPARDV